MITLKKATAEDMEKARKKKNSKRMETIEDFVQMNSHYAEVTLSCEVSHDNKRKTE